MQKQQKQHPSVLNQELGELIRELKKISKTFTSKTAMWKGNVYTLRRRCGHPNCHCADGKLHESTALDDRSGDKPRTVTLKGGEIEQFRRMTEKWTNFRNARARVTKINKRILEIVDRLGEIRLKEGLKKKKK